MRAAGDPERSGAAKEQGRGWSGYVLQRKLKQGCLGDFTGPILGVTGRDGVARTFNRITVELLDVTADVAFGTPFEDALDELFGLRANRNGRRPADLLADRRTCAELVSTWQRETVLKETSLRNATRDGFFCANRNVSLCVRRSVT